MKPIRISKGEFDRFRELQIEKRNDCHAVFSSNLSEIPWPFKTWGPTPAHLRESLQSQSPILDQIEGMFIEIRQSTSGGRFFIDYEGVYWKDNEKSRHRFVEWIRDESFKNNEEPAIGRREMMSWIKARKKGAKH